MNILLIKIFKNNNYFLKILFKKFQKIIMNLIINNIINIKNYWYYPKIYWIQIKNKIIQNYLL